MIMYINQLEHPDIALSTSLHPEWTIATAGCGICSWFMVLKLYNFDNSYDLKKMANLALKNSCMDSTGLNIHSYNKIMSKLFNLSVTETDDASYAQDFILSGKGYEIINVNTSWFNVSTGHYIVLKQNKEDMYEIMDPSMYTLGRPELIDKDINSYRDHDFVYVPWNYISRSIEGKHPAFPLISKNSS